MIPGAGWEHLSYAAMLAFVLVGTLPLVRFYRLSVLRQRLRLLDGHIDPDLFDVFIDKKVYLEYAKRFMQPDQIDEVDVTKLPGYRPLS